MRWVSAGHVRHSAHVARTSCLVHASGRPSPPTPLAPSLRALSICLSPILTSCRSAAQRFGTWAEREGDPSRPTDKIALTPIASRAFNMPQNGRLLLHQWHHRREHHRYGLPYPCLPSRPAVVRLGTGPSANVISRMRLPPEDARIARTSCLVHASGRPSPATPLAPSLSRVESAIDMPKKYPRVVLPNSQ